MTEQHISKVSLFLNLLHTFSRCFVYLYVSDLSDQFKTEEIREDLGNVIDHGRDAEKRRRAAVILQMPEQESEDQSDAKSHPPRDEEK